MMILELHRQGLSITAIARRSGRDPKTVRKYIERGLELPAYGPRRVGRPNKLAPYLDYLRERIAAFPDLTAVRLSREIRERGHTGAYTAVKRFVSAIRPDNQPKPFEVRFETPPGYQGQVDFARFVTTFTDEPGISRIVWLFSLVLGYSRHIFARFVMHQDLQTLLRCHMLAFNAIGGVPIEILYDRMKTVRAQVLSKRDPLLDNFAHSLVEEFEAAATTLLSAVKRHIGTAQQFIRRLP